MEFLHQWLQRIEAKLDQHLNGPEDPTVGTAEAMKLLGVKNRTSLYRRCQQLKIEPFARGQYRRIDIENAKGREVYTKLKRAKEDAEAEVRTESQRIQTKPSKHDD